MFERIVVPLDGTPVAEQALGPAVSVAREEAAHVHLVTVERPAAVELEPSIGVLDDDYLEEMAEGVSDAGVPSVSTQRLTGDKTPAVLEAYRKEVGADLIVMCTHGRRGMERVWLGSVADDLVRRSEVPILLVRAGTGERSGGANLRAATRFKRILVALDGTHFSRQALEQAARLGGKVGTTYVLAHVVAGSGGTAAEPQQKAQAMAEAKMKLEVQAFTEGGYAAEFAMTSSASVAQGIIDLAARHEAEVIVIATHARSGVGRMVLGSVADEVIRSADLPVLVVRPPGP